VSYSAQERKRWEGLATALDGHVRWSEQTIVSLSRVKPWKIDYLPPDPAPAFDLQQPVRTRLTAFGEARSKPFAIYRDSISPARLPAVGATQVPNLLRRMMRKLARRGPGGLYTLSQFMVDVAPRWAEPAPLAAIVVTDHGAADWIIVEHDHVQIGWERVQPTVDQLRLSIGALQELTAIPRSPLPFR
jgi:hypothetical protein